MRRGYALLGGGLAKPLDQCRDLFELFEIDSFVFEEWALCFVNVRRVGDAVDQSRAGGISGSGVLGCSCACFGFNPMIANFVPSLSDVLSFQCAGMRNASDSSFVLFSCVIALLSTCPVFLRGADELAVAQNELGYGVELQRRLVDRVDGRTIRSEDVNTAYTLLPYVLWGRSLCLNPNSSHIAVPWRIGAPPRSTFRARTFPPDPWKLGDALSSHPTFTQLPRAAQWRPHS